MPSCAGSGPGAIPGRAMAEDRPGGVVLTVRGVETTVRRMVRDFFTARGWREHRLGPELTEYRTGNRWMTILLGGLAGPRFHLVAPLRLRRTRVDGAAVIEIHYRWGEQVGRALGGALGRARAGRTHLATAAALEQTFAEAGLLVQVRGT